MQASDSCNAYGFAWQELEVVRSQWKLLYSILGLYRDNGKENGNYYREKAYGCTWKELGLPNNGGSKGKEHGQLNWKLAL